MTPEQVMEYAATRALIVLLIAVAAYVLVWPVDFLRNRHLDSQPRLGRRTPHKYLSFRNIAFTFTFIALLSVYKELRVPAKAVPESKLVSESAEPQIGKPIDPESIEGRFVLSACESPVEGQVFSRFHPALNTTGRIVASKIYATNNDRFIVECMHIRAYSEPYEGPLRIFEATCEVVRNKDGAFKVVNLIVSESSLGDSFK